MGALSKDLIKTADSLRSQLAKNALITLEELYEDRGKVFDSQVENMMPCLLKKASDTNAFISDQGKRALTALCLNCSEAKIYNGLNNFVTSKNPSMRSQVASAYGHVLTKLGPKVKTFKDSRSLISNLSTYLSDANQTVRENTRDTFSIMLTKSFNE